jgi:hypothetical protein
VFIPQDIFSIIFASFISFKNFLDKHNFEQFKLLTHITLHKILESRMKHFFSILFLSLLFLQLEILPQGLAYNQGPKLFDARVGDNGVLLSDGRALILGGHGTGFVRLNSAEIWNPSTNAFTKFTMNDYRDYCAVIKLQNGMYLLAGGMSSNLGVGQLQSMEIFNPLNNSFTPAANMNYVRTWSRGAQLTNGKVLLVGCWYDNTSGIIGDLYDPVADACVATGNMTVSRSNSFVLPMNDSSALVFGGNDPHGMTNYEQIDLYNPSTNSFTLFQDKLLPMDTLWFPIYSLSDIAESYKMSNGKFIMLAGKSMDSKYYYKLFTIDPATKTIDTFAVNPPLPYYDGSSGDSTYYLSPVLDNVNNRLYLFSVKPAAVGSAFKVSTVDLTTHQLYNTTGLISVPYSFSDTPRLLLKDGRLFIAGGSFSDNSDPVDSTFFLTLQPTAVKDVASVPSDYILQQNYPNPFNPSTIIKYSLANESNVKLILFNSLGQLVKILVNSPQSVGIHEINFSASGLSSGVYFYTLYAGSSNGTRSFYSSRKMLLLK